MDLSNIKPKLLNFFSDKYNLLLILILFFGFVVRLYFFFNTLEQPLWWDESQYAEEARRIGLDLETNDIWYYRRTILLPIFWAGLFFVGLGESALRFTEVLFSVLLIFATYLVGKEMFNKQVGLIAALGITFSRIILFETTRLLNSVPAAAFMMLAVYYFYKYNTKDNKTKYIYLFGLFSGLALSIRFATFLALISFIAAILLKEKFKFWKNKHIICAFLLILIILSPFFLLYNKNYPGGVKDFFRHYGELGIPTEEKQPYLGLNGLFLYSKEIPNNIGMFLFITFLIGLIFLLEFILVPDLIFKNENLQRNIFLLLFILPPFIYHGMKSLNVEERYLIGILPIIAILSGYGLYKVYGYLKEYNKYFINCIVFILLAISFFYQLQAANEAINSKLDSYSQVKEAALWMKENSNSTDVIISNSIPQTQYYSDRSVYYLENGTEIFNLRPKFFVVSIYEQSAKEYYEFPEKNKDKLKVVNSYFIDKENTRPSLVIYEFNSI